MLDKLEKHNNKKISYVVNRRFNVIKNTILSLLTSFNRENSTIYNNNYLLSTKK